MHYYIKRNFVIPKVVPFYFSQLRPNVLEIIIHPQYDPTTLNNDIALLRLHTPVTLSDRIGLVCLPASMPCSMHHLIPGKSGIVTGWGVTDDGVLSQHLQEVNLTVAHTDDCLNNFKQLGKSQGVFLPACPQPF